MARRDRVAAVARCWHLRGRDGDVAKAAIEALESRQLLDGSPLQTTGAEGVGDGSVPVVDIPSIVQNESAASAGAPALAIPVAADSTPVNIPDVHLEGAIRSALYWPYRPITIADMASLTGLVASSEGISDLTGLQYAVNLKTLYLSSNGISDLTPLSGLRQLTELDLSYNQVSDVTPLSGLTQLTGLALCGNHISNVAPLSGLTRLQSLAVPGNQIDSVTPLSGLTQLISLELYNNRISDVTPLSGLMQLRQLLLNNNQITDLTPLSGLTQLVIDVRNNCVDTTSGSPSMTVIKGWIDQGTVVVYLPQSTFGTKHSFVLTDADNDLVTIAIRGGGKGMLLPDNIIDLSGATSKSVLTITVKKRAAGDGLFHLSGITSDGPLKAINASAVVLSGQVQINTLNRAAGKASVFLNFRAISDADVRVQGMPVSAITVGGVVSGSRIAATGSIRKLSAAALLDSEILVGVASDFAGQFAGLAGDFADTDAKLGSLTVPGQKLPKGSSYPAYVSRAQVSAPSIGAMKLANVDSTAGAVQAHVLADTGTLTITALNPVMDGVSVLPAGTWKQGKAGRPGIFGVV